MGYPTKQTDCQSFLLEVAVAAEICWRHSGLEAWDHPLGEEPGLVLTGSAKDHFLPWVNLHHIRESFHNLDIHTCWSRDISGLLLEYLNIPVAMLWVSLVIEGSGLSGCADFRPAPGLLLIAWTSDFSSNSFKRNPEASPINGLTTNVMIVSPDAHLRQHARKRKATTLFEYTRV